MDDPTGSLLTPNIERTVTFYDDAILVAQTADGQLYVPIRPLVDFLGLDRRAQQRRIARDPVLAPRMRSVSIAAADGKRYGMICLPLSLLPGWLFGIDTSRVKLNLVEKLNRYRAECFDVLWSAFKGDVPSTPDTVVDAGGGELSGAALALEIATAVQHLARQQLAMEARLDRAAHVVGQLDRRVSALEVRVGGIRTVTEAEAAEIAMAVKNVGQRLASQGDPNGYARVYSEMYRRYAVSSYKNVPAARYEEVLAWLHSWRHELTQSEETPRRNG